ncbi:MAG: hypothetical protein Q4F80_08355, partial [bacterium]|nr:hypothetical protein [bacterium]
GLRKAVSVLNSAITMNMALDGETPYDNANLFGYMMKHMAVMETVTKMEQKYIISSVASSGSANNAAFYTTDGMRFEFRNGQTQFILPLYENKSVYACTMGQTGGLVIDSSLQCGGCGSFGLNNNPDKTTKPPCLIMVDVNGDRKPNPANVNCKETQCAKPFKLSDPLGTKLTDIFSVMITDKEAIPYGVAAQKAMYSARQ